MLSSSSWNFWSFCLINHKYTYTVHAQKWAKLRLHGHYKAFRYLTQLLVRQGEWAALVSIQQGFRVSAGLVTLSSGEFDLQCCLCLFSSLKTTQKTLRVKQPVNTKHQLCVAQMLLGGLWHSLRLSFMSQNSEQMPFSHICIDFVLTTVLYSIAIIGAVGTTGAANIQ